MKTTKRFPARTTLVALGLACGGAAQAAPVAVTGDPVLYWNEVAIANYTGGPLPTSRGFAMVDVALYEAVNASLGSPYRSYLGGVATQGGDTRVAASVAARNVLAHLNPAQTATFDAALSESLALVPDGAAKTAGIATGQAVATAIIASRANDGSTAAVPYAFAPPGTPGRYQPTPPGNANPAAPQWATVTPWTMTSPDQFRPDAPPALDSVEYAAAYNEVKEIGSATSATRTADQTAAVQFWAPAGQSAFWVRAAIDEAQKKNLSTIEYAQLMARLTTSIADSLIAAWDAKYTYDFWRPITGIQGGDLDGNPATAADPGWTSLIAAPAHQSYISGTPIMATAATTILELSLGDDIDFCLTSGTERCWADFDAAALEAALSRVWGGIHWRFDGEGALGTGRSIGEFAFANFFGPLPAAVPEAGAAGLFALSLVGLVAARRTRRVRREAAPS